MFEGRFGRTFRSLEPAEFDQNGQRSEVNLAALAAAMVAAPDCPKDGIDGEESGIPAAFTYLGQFIDHDLTFDPSSSLERQNDPDGLVDFRTPSFDLDSVYGRGPDDQPYLYDTPTTFALGDSLTGMAAGAAISAADLPRATARSRAIIGDPRNDENVIVSQLQALFLRFHNRYVAEHPGLTFTQAQRAVRFHYQWVVLHDFLRRIVAPAVYDEVLPHVAAGTDPRSCPPRLRYYHARNDAFMPLEFAVAAYRFGHSMVRPGYRLNDDVLEPIFPFKQPPPECPGPARGLTGFDRFPANWAIDWSRFIDLDVRASNDATRLQLAYRIDTSLVNPLGGLPGRVTGDAPPLDSLAARNLIRGWRLRLPSGQDVARAMGIEPLDDAQLLLGKAVDPPVDPADAPTPIADIADGVFRGNAPLWVYVLAEAAAHRRGMDVRTADGGGLRTVQTPHLGPVGGRIVAETFAGIQSADSDSFWSLHPRWKPSIRNEQGEFGLRELIGYALGR